MMRVLMMTPGIYFSILLALVNMMEFRRLMMKPKQPLAYNVVGLCCVLEFG
jgi:hypothetical protein